MSSVFRELQPNAYQWRIGPPDLDNENALCHILAMNNVCSVLGLPNLQAGKLYPTHAVYECADILFPALLDIDVGRGSRLAATTLPCEIPHVEKLQKQLSTLKNPASGRWLKYLAEQQHLHNTQSTLFDNHLGNLGRENDQVLLLSVGEVFEPEYLESRNEGLLHIMVIAGSAGFGSDVLRSEVEANGYRGLPVKSPLFKRFLSKHEHCQQVAKLHRDILTLRTAEVLNVGVQLLLDQTHNVVRRSVQTEAFTWLHRCGASDANLALNIITNTDKTRAYLVAANEKQLKLQSVPFEFSLSETRFDDTVAALEQDGVWRRVCQFDVLCRVT